MKKVFSYITSFILIICASILVIYGLFNGFKILPIIIGAVLGYLGLLIPAAYKNQEAMKNLKDNFVAINTYVAGVTFRQDDVQKAYEEYLKNNNVEVELIADPNNSFNEDAVKVMINDIHVGYIPNRDLKTYLSFLNTYKYVSSDVEFLPKKELYINLRINFLK